MGKLVFWIVVAFVVLFAVRLYGAAQAKKRRELDAAHGAAGP
jgi:large-conductance mechanosensitive channel